MRIRRKPLVTFNFACLNPKFVHCILCDETVNAADIVNRTGTMICPGYLASVRVQAFNLGFAVECSTAKSTKSTPRKQCLFASFFFPCSPAFILGWIRQEPSAPVQHKKKTPKISCDRSRISNEKAWAFPKIRGEGGGIEGEGPLQDSRQDETMRRKETERTTRGKSKLS